MTIQQIHTPQTAPHQGQTSQSILLVAHPLSQQMQIHQVKSQSVSCQVLSPQHISQNQSLPLQESQFSQSVRQVPASQLGHQQSKLSQPSQQMHSVLQSVEQSYSVSQQGQLSQSVPQQLQFSQPLSQQIQMNKCLQSTQCCPSQSMDGFLLNQSTSQSLPQQTIELQLCHPVSEQIQPFQTISHQAQASQQSQLSQSIQQQEMSQSVSCQMQLSQVILQKPHQTQPMQSCTQQLLLSQQIPQQTQSSQINSHQVSSRFIPLQFQSVQHISQMHSQSDHLLMQPLTQTIQPQMQQVTQFVQPQIQQTTQTVYPRMQPLTQFVQPQVTQFIPLQVQQPIQSVSSQMQSVQPFSQQIQLKSHLVTQQMQQESAESISQKKESVQLPNQQVQSAKHICNHVQHLQQQSVQSISPQLHLIQPVLQQPPALSIHQQHTNISSTTKSVSPQMPVQSITQRLSQYFPQQIQSAKTIPQVSRHVQTLQKVPQLPASLSKPYQASSQLQLPKAVPNGTHFPTSQGQLSQQVCQQNLALLTQQTPIPNSVYQNHGLHAISQQAELIQTLPQHGQMLQTLSPNFQQSSLHVSQNFSQVGIGSNVHSACTTQSTSWPIPCLQSGIQQVQTQQTPIAQSFPVKIQSSQSDSHVPVSQPTLTHHAMYQISNPQDGTQKQHFESEMQAIQPVQQQIHSNVVSQQAKVQSCILHYSNLSSAVENHPVSQAKIDEDNSKRNCNADNSSENTQQMSLLGCVNMSSSSQKRLQAFQHIQEHKISTHLISQVEKIKIESTCTPPIDLVNEQNTKNPKNCSKTEHKRIGKRGKKRGLYLTVLNVEQGSVVECKLDSKGKTVIFKFDIVDMPPEEVANNLLIVNLLHEQYAAAFIEQIKEIVCHLREHPDKIPVLQNQNIRSTTSSAVMQRRTNNQKQDSDQAQI